MKRAVDELGCRETFRGYGPEQGYEFLRSTIAQRDYRDRNIEIADDEIFVSDGSKCDCGHVLDILGGQNKIAVPDPVYPAYVDTNVMAGHTGQMRQDGSYEGIHYLPCTAENHFVPEPPNEHLDLVYLCFPNNPTGAVASQGQLSRWVDYAREHDALLLFDAAYEAYIFDPEIPPSVDLHFQLWDASTERLGAPGVEQFWSRRIREERLPVLDPTLLLALLTADIPGSELDRRVEEADLVRLWQRLFGEAPPTPLAGLALAAGASVRDLYRCVIDSDRFRTACGRISAGYGW